MKKRFLATTLILVVIAAAAWADSAEKQTINYKRIVEYFEIYYDDFNVYGQDAETIDLMDAYWAPEFTATAYFPVPVYPKMDLDGWKMFILSTHVNMREILTCEELSIDTKKLTVASRFLMELFDRQTGEKIIQMDSIGIYTLKVGQHHDIKITDLKLFASDPVTLMKLFFPGM